MSPRINNVASCRALVLLMLLALCGLPAVVPVAAQPPPPFQCCRYNAHALPSLVGQSCAWTGSGGCARTVEGWTLVRSWEAAYGCSECQVFPEGLSAVDKQEKKEAAAVEKKEVAGRQASNYPCCLYSDPNNGWIKPIDTVCNNPVVQMGCESTWEGLTLAAEWRVLEMYNQCYFLVVQNNSAV